MTKSVLVSKDSETLPAEEQKTPVWQTAIGVGVLTALVVAAVLAVVQIYPHKLPTTANPSFVDNIFDSRVVILGVRVALIFAAGYIVISVVGLIVARRWLSQLGPFKASDPIARLDNNAQLLDSGLQDAIDTIQDLEQRLVESDESLAKAQTDIDALVALIDTIEAKKEGTNATKGPSETPKRPAENRADA